MAFGCVAQGLGCARAILALASAAMQAAPRCATRYTGAMIKSFRHKGLRKLFETGCTSGIMASHSKRLRMQLAALDTARTIEDMDIPGFRLHPL